MRFVELGRNTARRWTTVDSLVWHAWLLELLLALPTAAMLAHVYGRRAASRYVAGLTTAGLLRHGLLRWLSGRTKQEPISPGDPLSLARLCCANVLAGLVASGIRDRRGPAGTLAWSLTLLGATALDWLDGPLARRTAPTRHGAILDIEADSWLTLWAAVAAAWWGGLPRWVILPPLLRYLHPLLDVRDGVLPRGGGPAWSRVTGTAQMALLLAALAPIHWRPRRPVSIALAALVSGSQLATRILLLRRRAHDLGRRHGASVSRTSVDRSQSRSTKARQATGAKLEVSQGWSIPR